MVESVYFHYVKIVGGEIHVTNTPLASSVTLYRRYFYNAWL